MEGLPRISPARRCAFGHLRRSDPILLGLDAANKRLYHTVFIVRKSPTGRNAPIAFLCSTNTWKAYAATPFSPTWKGIKKSIGNNGFENSAGHPPAFCFYRPHHAGQGTYQMGFRMPWPIVGPYTLMGPEEWDYSHLCRQDRFTQVWLETNGYEYDVLSDTDVHLDPHVLDGYKVVYVVGHSEYWSFESMGGMSRCLWTRWAAMPWCSRETPRSGACRSMPMPR